MSNEMNKEMSQGTDVQTEERYQVTKRDLRKTAARYNFMACNIFNYESQMGPAIAWAMAPVLRKIYKKDDEYKMALNNHFNYFNSTTVMSSMILGATLAVEEKDGIAAKDTVQSLKTSLMDRLQEWAILLYGCCGRRSSDRYQDIWHSRGILLARLFGFCAISHFGL